eukprot:3724463-Alexandrium_andersonii.AAC.1
MRGSQRVRETAPHTPRASCTRHSFNKRIQPSSRGIPELRHGPFSAPLDRSRDRGYGDEPGKGGKGIALGSRG